MEEEKNPEGHEVDEILKNILDDEEFRKQFESDRKSVLSNFKLTKAQYSALLALQIEVFLLAAGSLDALGPNASLVIPNGAV